MKKVIAVVTSAILCFSLVGCKGSNKEKETDTANNETTTSTVAQKETKVFSEEKKAATYDNFLKVEVGESYDDTVKELGEPNKLVFILPIFYFKKRTVAQRNFITIYIVIYTFLDATILLFMNYCPLSITQNKIIFILP